MSEWGPLQPLIGEWEGEGGLDTAFSHTQDAVLGTPYLEKLTMKPFGPVANGRQSLYGLDYKSAMWRGSEDNPFHTEVGYWLWDEATGEVLRGFVVPRGITVLAGGTAAADASSARTNTSPRTRARSATKPRSRRTPTVGRTTKRRCCKWPRCLSRSRTPITTHFVASVESFAHAPAASSRMSCSRVSGTKLSSSERLAFRPHRLGTT
jgi:hypothetical protein